MLGRGVMLNVVEKERRALVDSPSSSSWQTWQLSATLSSQVQLRCPVAAGKQKQMHTRVMYTKHVTKSLAPIIQYMGIQAQNVFVWTYYKATKFGILINKYSQIVELNHLLPK